MVIEFGFVMFGGGKGIRTLVGVSPNGFQDRLVMTTSHSRSEFSPQASYLSIWWTKTKTATLFQELRFMAEGKGFEPLWAWAQTVFKTASLWPLRYPSVYELPLGRFHRIFNFFRNIFRNAVFGCFRSARKVSVYKAFWPFCDLCARKFSKPPRYDRFVVHRRSRYKPPYGKRAGDSRLVWGIQARTTHCIISQTFGFGKGFAQKNAKCLQKFFSFAIMASERWGYDMQSIFDRAPDVEVSFHFNGTRKNPAVNGYRPAHRITDTYLTTGIHHYFGTESVPADGTAQGTITFLSPDAYPHSLWIGKKIAIQEGERIVGYATVLKIYNPVLLFASITE